MSKSINEWVDEIHKNAQEHGWWDSNRNFSELLQLVVDELSEVHEEYRNNRGVTETYYSGKPHYTDQTGITTEVIKYSMIPHEELGITKPEGIPSELADVVIRIMDICGFYGIDLEKIMEIKHEYNKTRPYKHGNKLC